MDINIRGMHGVIGVNQLEVEISKELHTMLMLILETGVYSSTHLDINLVQLHHCYRLAGAAPSAVTKDKLNRLHHLSPPGLIDIQPALRSKDIRILPENILASLHSDKTLSNPGTSRDKVAVDRVPLRWYLLHGKASEWNIQSQAFVDHRLSRVVSTHLRSNMEHQR